MARQIGLIQITGTVGGICFYCMDGVYYARQKSSLTAKRVKTDPAFAETMKYAERMAYASKIASKIYRETIPKEERSRDKYREIVGMVMQELRLKKNKSGTMDSTPVDAERQLSQSAGSFKQKSAAFVLQQKERCRVTGPVLFDLSPNQWCGERTRQGMPLRYKHRQEVSTNADPDTLYCPKLSDG